MDSFLTESWKLNDDTGQMNDEMISALLSRITPNIVWVNEESQLDC